MTTYIVLDSENYGISSVEMTDEEYAALSDADKEINIAIHGGETLEDYLARKWTIDGDMKYWLFDSAKKMAINKARRDAAQALADAEEASRLAAIVPPTQAELDAQAAEQFSLMKSVKANEIHNALRFNLEKGATYNGKAVSTDQYSLILLNGAVTVASSGQWPADGTFKLDGVLSPVTSGDILDIFGAVQSHVIGCYNREKELLDSLDTVTDIAGLEALDLTW